jgi:HlyD family secretion protein
MKKNINKFLKKFNKKNLQKLKEKSISSKNKLKQNFRNSRFYELLKKKIAIIKIELNILNRKLNVLNKRKIYPYLSQKKLTLNEYTRKKSKKLYFYINHNFLPKLNEKVEGVVNFLTIEQGEETWSNLDSSRKWNKVIIWTFVSFASFGFVWSVVARVDETVQSTGKLEPIGTTIDVKVPIGGVIEKILVTEGELVKKDQTLLELDTTAASAKLQALERVKSQINADIVLSKIQLGGEEDIGSLTSNQKLKLTSLNNEYNSRINASANAVKQIEFQKISIMENLKSQKEVLSIREEILKNLEEVTEIGGLSKIKYLKEQQEVIQLRGRVESTKSELEKISATLAEAENKLANTIAASKIDFSSKIEENVKQVAQIENQISDTKLTLKYQEITSPLDGLVFDLQPAAPGYVVGGNDKPILKIVPVDDLVARVFVSNRDIAFLKKGQLVNIRIDAYPYNEFGEIDGKIESIGSDVLEPNEEYNFYRFPVTIKMDQPFLLHKNKELPLITGMSVSVNIVLRQRPVISLFTERILPFWSGLEQL